MNARRNHTRSFETKILRRINQWNIILLGLALIGCQTTPDALQVLYPPQTEAARRVLEVVFQQTVTLPDNFVLRPDEMAAVTTDVQRGLIYVGSRDGNLLALDDTRGEVVWEYSLDGALSGKSIISEDGEQLIFGTDNGMLVAFDLNKREPQWTYETRGTIRNTPLVKGDVVYFVNSRDQVFALDRRSGTWRWQYPSEDRFQTNFMIHGRAGLAYVSTEDSSEAENGRIITGFADGTVAVISASSGVELWTANLAPPQGGDFVDADGTPWIDKTANEVIVSAQNTGVFGLSLADGSQNWHKPVRGAGDVVAGPGNLFVFASSLEGIFAIERGGQTRWHQQVDPGVLSNPVVVEDTLFVTHSEAGLLAYDVWTGEFLARFDPGSGMSSIPSFEQKTRRFYAISNRGVLFAFRVVG